MPSRILISEILYSGLTVSEDIFIWKRFMKHIL